MAPDRRRFFWLAVAMFALSLLAKELSLTLPAVLLALDAYPLGRLRATPRQAMGRMVLSLVIEKWPFLALSAAWMIIAALGAAQSGVARSLAEYGLPQRAAQALYGLAFYPAKTILPIGLSNLYSIPPAMNPLEVRFIISAAAAIAITIALVLLRRRLPAGLTAWTCFAILVLPVLGLVQTGHQLVADRYSYLPAVALSAVVSGLLLRAWQKCGGGGAGLGGRAMLVATSLAVLIAAAALARDQIRVWRDSQSLWTHAVEVDPDCPIAHNNLGAVLARQGESQEAIEQFRRAIELDGDYAAAHRNLREMLSQAGTD